MVGWESLTSSAGAEKGLRCVPLIDRPAAQVVFVAPYPCIPRTNPLYFENKAKTASAFVTEKSA